MSRRRSLPNRWTEEDAEEEEAKEKEQIQLNPVALKDLRIPGHLQEVVEVELGNEAQMTNLQPATLVLESLQGRGNLVLNSLMLEIRTVPLLKGKERQILWK